MQVTVEIPDEFAGYIVPAGSNPARLLLEDSVAAGLPQPPPGPWNRSARSSASPPAWKLDPFLQRYEIYDYNCPGSGGGYRHFRPLQKRKAG